MPNTVKLNLNMVTVIYLNYTSEWVKVYKFSLTEIHNDRALVPDCSFDKSEIDIKKV